MPSQIITAVILGGKGRHSVYYRLLEDRVLIVRILHDSMDVERHLQDEVETEMED